MAAEFVQDYETFDLGDFTLQHGVTLKDAKLAYKTFGELNGDGATRSSTRRGIGLPLGQRVAGRRGHGPRPPQVLHHHPEHARQRAIELAQQHAAPHDKANFPNVTFYDQVEAQHKLVAERFGIETLPLVTGWSMGAGQTYQWAVSHPEMVQRAAPFCGSSKTSEHKFVFLEGVKARPDRRRQFQGRLLRHKAGRQPAQDGPRVRRVGILAGLLLDRVYTDMGHSHRLGVDLAFPTLEDFLVQYWEGHFLDRRDVNDLLSMLWTWQHGDIGQTPGFDGDHVKALQSIRAKLIAMPAVKDLYFPPEDEEYSSQYIPNGEVRVIPGVWVTSQAAVTARSIASGSTTSSGSCSPAEGRAMRPGVFARRGRMLQALPQVGHTRRVARSGRVAEHAGREAVMATSRARGAIARLLPSGIDQAHRVGGRAAGSGRRRSRAERSGRCGT